MRWFDGGVKSAFDKSGELVLELVPPPDAEMQALIDELGTARGGPPLTDQLNDHERAQLRDALAKLGQPANALDTKEPWLAAVLLSVLPVRQAGYDTSLGAEAVLTSAAEIAHKRVTGLETARQQFGYFDTLSPVAQHALLDQALDNVSRAGATLDTMVAYWGRGDAPALAQQVNGDLARSNELRDALLLRRNRNWANWIAGRMRAPGTVFVAVGAGHLAGTGSVQADLTRRGFKVERLAY